MKIEIFKKFQKKKSPIIYGVTDRSDQPWWEQANDFIIDHSWVTAKEKSLFFQSLKLLVISGVRLSRAIKILAERTKNPRLERVLHTVDYDLNNGFRFSNALAKYPDVFSNSEVKMVLSAEITGRLEQVLEYITTQIQKNIKLRSQVKSALIYPTTILVGIVLAFIVIMIWVVPQFKDLFGNFGADLPTSTKILISMSNFLQRYWWVVISGGVGGVIFFQNWKNSPAGRQTWDRWLFEIPGIKKLVQNFQTIQITTNFSTLLSSGLPVPKALQALREIVSNSVTKEAIRTVEKQVVAGDMLHEGFAKNEVFDPVIAEIVEIGEKSGSIQEILAKTGEQYELEFDSDMQNFSKLIEPVVLLIVAGVIIFLGLAIMTPILQLQDLFSQA